MDGILQSDGMGGLLPSDPRAHVSFRAGILNRDPATNRVEADPRKGMFRIITTNDGLMHLQWRPRNSGSVEQDLILFNGDAEVKQVTSCPPSARVYVLKWKEGDTRMFFWMQGSDASQDAANIASVNRLLESGPEGISQMNLDTLRSPQTPPQPVTQNQPGSNPATSPRPTPMEPPSTVGLDPINLERYQGMIPGTALAQRREEVLKTPTLLDLLNMDILQPALQSSSFQEKIPALLAKLPEQDRSIDKLADVLRSPSLRGQAAALSNALHSGHANEILSSFGLPVSSGQQIYRYGLKQFLDALVKYEKDQNTGS
ncbi:Proteasomal ubiquitin receptor Rpn13/ADRM1 [Gracilaria domingensis]|nr:Proteasomal ubiquitin receptor Rpn13/ADRM1 [Gracilaria domingensis]